MNKRKMVIYTSIILFFMMGYIVAAFIYSDPFTIGLTCVVGFAGSFTLFVKWTDYCKDKKDKETKNHHAP